MGIKISGNRGPEYELQPEIYILVVVPLLDPPGNDGTNGWPWRNFETTRPSTLFVIFRWFWKRDHHQNVDLALKFIFPAIIPQKYWFPDPNISDFPSKSRKTIFQSAA